MVREWVPGIQRLGIEPTDAWYTQHGNSPQILSGGTARDLGAMRKILATDDWHGLKEQLLGFVDNLPGAPGPGPQRVPDALGQWVSGRIEKKSARQNHLARALFVIEGWRRCRVV